MRIRPVEAEFDANGQTGMTKKVVAFRSFANAPKKNAMMMMMMMIRNVLGVRECDVGVV
jgi:hypothetical protein